MKSSEQLLEMFEREARELIVERDWVGPSDREALSAMVENIASHSGSLPQLQTPSPQPLSLAAKIIAALGGAGVIAGVLLTLSPSPPPPRPIEVHTTEPTAPLVFPQRLPLRPVQTPRPTREVSIQTPTNDVAPPRPSRHRAAHRSGQQSAKQLFQLAFEAQGDKELGSARAYYEKLIRRYPKSEFALDAHYYLGELHLHERRIFAAKSEFLSYLQKAPAGRLGEQAWFKLSVCHRRLGDQDGELEVLQELSQKFSDSDLFTTRQARKRLQQLEAAKEEESPTP